MKRGNQMHSIPWQKISTTKNNVIADIGDIRLILQEHPKQWTLQMGIRVYTTDRSKSMIRPPVTVTQFQQPCDPDKAKIMAEEYFTNFLSSVLSNISTK